MTEYGFTESVILRVKTSLGRVIEEGVYVGFVQSASLTENQKLATLLPGQELTVYLNGPQVIISGVQTAANVTQPNIVASKVMPVSPWLPSTVSSITAGPDRIKLLAGRNLAGALTMQAFWLGKFHFVTLLSCLVILCGAYSCMWMLCTAGP